jgi:putative hydrolase of the HAD superfamily
MNIVFDFGAVLVGWQPAQVVAKHFPMLATEPAKAQALGKSIFTHADWQAFDQGLLAPAEVAAGISTALHLPLDATQGMVNCIGDHLQQIQSTVDVFRELQAKRSQYGIQKLFFLSNMPEPYARALERNYAWVSEFDGGIFSCDVKLIKPHAAIYELAEKRLNASGQDILFIDDHADNIAAAQARNWQTIHLTDAAQLPTLLRQKLKR